MHLLNYLAITSVAEFEAHRSRWDALYRADPHAQLFLSSAWLHAHLTVVSDPWTVHVLTEGDELVAGIATATRPLPHRRLPVARELRFATDPLADYQGMLARPGREADAIAAFAQRLGAAPWDRLALRDVHDPRIGRLAELVAAGPRIALHRGRATSCYQMDLPATYELYLAGLSERTRRVSTRLLATLRAELPGLRVTTAPDGDADAHIRAVVGLNSARWGTSTIRRRRLEELYHAVSTEGIARFTAIWDGTRPVAAGAAWIDAATATYGLALSAYDGAYARFSPGNSLMTLLIQDAIAQGCRTFDFLRGEEEYKRTRFATRSSLNEEFDLVRAGLRDSALRATMPVYDAAKKAFFRVAMRAR
jgi:CelD/BcsL family acetyltransferase involved in cellulose biosynthesis